MSILLTHGYFINEDEKEQKIMRPYPPLGILYISSYLTTKGIKNTLFDTTFSSTEDFKKHILVTRPSIIAFYTNLMTKLNVLRLISFIKNEASCQHTKIILGGPDVTHNCDKYLLNGADVIVIGEGEQTMAELVPALENNTDLSLIDGIAFFNHHQTLMKTKAREKMKSLEELPLPNRAAIPIEKYLETWKTHHGQSSMTVSTQRGCPYTCKWCSTAVYGQSYRRRPAKQVAAELKMLKETYNPDAIWFVDDVFTVSHKWLQEFHDELMAQNAMIPFECITRAERLNDEVLALLKNAGCFRIWIGAESGSQDIIDEMDRRVDVDVVKSMIQKTNAMGIETGTFIMLGYPKETIQDINKTIQYLKEANPTHYTITIAYPIKGTGLYQQIEKSITVQPEWHLSTDRDIDFERTYPRRFYDYAVDMVSNEVMLHKLKLQDNKNLYYRLKLGLKNQYLNFRMKSYLFQNMISSKK
jgi:anaerobic magnesium-protoporphyrin IX monomethyl ester cyclase